MERMVVAIGGNTLLSSDGSATGQRRRIEAAASTIAGIASEGRDVVLTHGNGPQVGDLLLQQEASTQTADQPLDVLVAQTQAQIGYVLQQALGNAGGERPVTVLTQVRVERDDPAFDDPSKPVGPRYTTEEAESKSFDTVSVTTATGATRHRRVVPSPSPREVIEIDRIRSLLADGETVICGGGGGIPVVRGSGGLEGVEAVVDKDRTSAALGIALGATELLILTDVDAVYRNYGTESQEPIERTTSAELNRLLDRGAFEAGTMRPKVQAAVDFVDSGGETAIITSTDAVADALAGDAGTKVLP
ncbi:MAG: carbamate kinase [Halanaeroarchaeum sp.]